MRASLRGRPADCQPRSLEVLEGQLISLVEAIGTVPVWRLRPLCACMATGSPHRLTKPGHMHRQSASAAYPRVNDKEIFKGEIACRHPICAA
jgi:hypothetical protein